MSTAPIRIGVIGLGWAGTHRHLPAIRRNRKYRIVGLADRRAHLAADWAREFGIPHAVEAGDIASIPWLHDVDAIDSATAPMSHHKLIRDALLCGKHVITEKPFAMKVPQGEELVHLARHRGLQLGIVHNFQFASSTLRLLQDIEQGRLGAIRSIVATQWGNPYAGSPFGTTNFRPACSSTRARTCCIWSAAWRPLRCGWCTWTHAPAAPVCVRLRASTPAIVARWAATTFQ